MSELAVRPLWLPQVELAFENLKAADIAEREEWCQVIREDEGPEAEAELRTKLAAHDQAMQPKPKPFRKGLRRDLNRANAAPHDEIKLRDALHVASKPLDVAPEAVPAKPMIATLPQPQPTPKLVRRVLTSPSEPKPEPKPPPSSAQQSPTPQLRLVPEPKSEPLVRFADEAPKANDDPPRLSVTRLSTLPVTARSLIGLVSFEFSANAIDHSQQNCDNVQRQRR